MSVLEKEVEALGSIFIEKRDDTLASAHFQKVCDSGFLSTCGLIVGVTLRILLSAITDHFVRFIRAPLTNDISKGGINSISKTISERHSKTELLSPPSTAEFIVSIISTQRYKSEILNCLAEDFDRDLELGVSLKQAKLRYWNKVLQCIPSLAQMWINRLRIIKALNALIHKLVY